MNIVKELRENMGMLQKELAIQLGVSQPTVSDWEHGKKDPTEENAKKIGEIFDCDWRAVLCRKPLHEKAASSNALRIPILGSIPAGVPIEAIEDVLDWEEVPADWARGGKEYFALRVKGSSMLPEYRDGDVVIFKRQDICESGQDCAVMVNGDDATFKRVKWSPKGVMLQALNPDYDSYLYTSDEWNENNGRILGVVAELRRKL